METIHDVPIILRREIEALYIAPFLEAFSKELGWEKTRQITVDVIKGIAAQAGRDAAIRAGGNTMEHFVEKVHPAFSAGGVQDSEVEIRQDGTLCIDITMCKYVDMYERLGMKELGSILSCERDAALFENFNTDYRFLRTKTIMKGCDTCDFRVVPKEKL